MEDLNRELYLVCITRVFLGSFFGVVTGFRSIGLVVGGFLLKVVGFMLSMMVEDINALFERLNFSEEEAIKVVSSKVKSLKIQGYEAWAIGKIMSDERVNKNVMYRVLKSLWFTKEEVNFVELKEGVFLVEFGVIEDRARILNLSLWLFDQCLFAMLPYVKDQGLDSYAFNFMLFWVRIFNIPLEYMDRQVALDVGKAIGNVVAIGWQDNDRRWTEFIRVRVKINVLKPLRRVVHFVGNDGVETMCAIKYERLPAF
ncbi:uncharacterized protein LOC108476101 [Gossypium arboreum]|uniref:uncharacterized protein LOC108476101 n=1 Tax=Gossypium arboreum TaxID=29729 RepID=UPI0008190359|nr:uncharacterized protein LOC108476101 [Gossypium arboreum]